MIRLWLGAPLALCGPQDALAHGTIAGTKGLYAGVLHPVVVPGHLLAIAASGLWIGQLGVERPGKPLLVLATFLAIGSALGLSPPWESAGLLLSSCALALGLLVAAERPLPVYAAMALAALVALAIGIDSAPDGSNTSTQRIVALLGTFIGVHLLILNLVAIVSSNRKHWAAIAIRILGSWIAASAILVLAFELKDTTSEARSPAP